MGVGDIVQGVGWGGLAISVPWFFGTSCLGSYVVAAWHGSLIDDGPGDVLTINWGPREHFLAWSELWESINSVGLVELCALCLFVGEEVVSHSLHIH